MKHDHPEPKPPCAHEALKFCAKCDAIECTACGEEWKKQTTYGVCYREHVDDHSPWRRRTRALLPERPGPWQEPYAPIISLAGTTTNKLDVQCSHSK